MNAAAVLRSLPRLARSAAAVGAAVTLLGAATCTDATTAQSSLVGGYSLSSVNGAALPYTVPGTGSDTVVISGGGMAMVEGGQYVVTASAAINGAEQQLVADQGTYTESGSQVNFQSALDSTVQYTAVRSDNVLTITLPGSLVGSTEASFDIAFQK